MKPPCQKCLGMAADAGDKSVSLRCEVCVAELESEIQNFKAGIWLVLQDLESSRDMHTPSKRLESCVAALQELITEKRTGEAAANESVSISAGKCPNCGHGMDFDEYKRTVGPCQDLANPHCASCCPGLSGVASASTVFYFAPTKGVTVTANGGSGGNSSEEAPK